MSVCISVMPDQPVSLEAARPSPLGERARRRLTQSAYHAVRQVNVEERQGVLTLSGRLPNYYLKQMAQAAVANMEGVRKIINRIDVVEPVH